MKINSSKLSVLCFLALIINGTVTAQQSSLELEINQLTYGEKHHFFGYIGQCRTIPWNESGRYILGLEIDRIDQMPDPEDEAQVFVIDTQNKNKIVYLAQTNAWNPQQGTMFYWNPNAPETPIAGAPLTIRVLMALATWLKSSYSTKISSFGNLVCSIIITLLSFHSTVLSDESIATLSINSLKIKHFKNQ